MPFQTASSALAGLKKGFDIVSENIATSKNNGIKPKSFTFLNTVSGRLNSGSYSPNTVSCHVTQNNNLLGALKEGTADTHMAFDSPKGYFVVSDGQTILFTRDGDFTPDADGNLKNSAGYFLMGWKLDQNGNIPAGTNTSVTDSLEIINVASVSGTFTETTEMDIRVNLPADATAGAYHQVNARAVDSLGISHDVTITYTKTANPLEWDVTITSPDAVAGGVTQVGGANNGAVYNNMTVQFDSDGLLVSYNGVPAETTPPQVQIDWGSTDANNSLITLDFGTVGADDMLRLMGDQAITVRNGDNGRGFSTVEGTYVDAEGTIFSVFRNSDKQKTFKMAVANFNAPNELAPESGNAFSVTGSSGDYVLGKANDAGFARVIAGKLEGNPTNLAEELTKMIELQHLYSGNVRSIQTEDDMLKKLGQI